MPESRITATDRLRQEGRWEEACCFRDEARRQLRAEGLSKTQAGDRAWAAMLEKYPPLPPTDVTEEWAADTFADAGRNAPDLVADTLWVYENLANRHAQPQDAPGSGAWALLQWARQYRNRFFEQMLPKAMTLLARREDQGAAGTDAKSRGNAEMIDAEFEEIKKLMGNYT